MGVKKISIVIPVYNEAESIWDVYREVEAVLSSQATPYEIIIIDDGSIDGTFDVVKKMHSAYPNIKIIRLTRNFGQAYALLAGFEIAQGDVVVIIDGDLQNPPDSILDLLSKIEEGYSFVNGWRRKRKDSVQRTLLSWCANRIISRVTGVTLKDYGCALFAVRKDLLDNLKRFGINAKFIKPLLVKSADTMIEIEVQHNPRIKGRSKYNVFKILIYGIDFILHFNKIPDKNHPYPFVIEETIL